MQSIHCKFEREQFRVSDALNRRSGLAVNEENGEVFGVEWQSYGGNNPPNTKIHGKYWTFNGQTFTEGVLPEQQITDIFQIAKHNNDKKTKLKEKVEQIIKNMRNTFGVDRFNSDRVN